MLDNSTELYNQGISFLKVDNNYHVLRGAEYIIRLTDGRELDIYKETNIDGINTIYLNHNQFSTNEKALNFFPKALKEEVLSFHTVEDLTNSSLGFRKIDNAYSTELYVPVKIEETKSPAGYKKLDLVTFIRFYLVEITNDNNITDTRISIIFDRSQPILIDQFEFNENSVEQYTTGYYITNFQQLDSVTRQCDGRIVQGRSSFSDVYCDSYASYFMDEEGEVHLTVTNTVNGVQKYDASQSKELLYKIVVSNTGDAASGNNVIVTHVPKEVTVVESSISNGVYNEEEHTITWTIDYINIGESVELTYAAQAPESLKGEDLIGKTTAQSDQSSEVQSNETIVTLTNTIAIIQNPNTGVYGVYIPYTHTFIPIYFIVICILSILAGFIYAKVIKRKRKSEIVE